MVRAHTHTHLPKHKQTPSFKQSYGVTLVIVKGSLAPLVLGNWRAFGDSLAKTSIISSLAPFSRLFWSYPFSMWIQWLFLVVSAYSLGPWGDMVALGMNIWINSWREEIVLLWVLTEEQSLQQSFNCFVPQTPSIRCVFWCSGGVSLRSTEVSHKETGSSAEWYSLLS